MSYRNWDSFPQEFFFHDKYNDPERGFCCSSPCCCRADDWHDDPRFRQQVAVSSTTGSAGPLSATAAAVPLATPINVVSTNINTCRLGATDNLISFSGLITIPAATKPTITTLIFQVLRSSCIGSAIAVGSAYTFSVSTTDFTSQSFNFSFTDSNVAPGTYTYSVQLAPGSIIGVAGTTILNATLNVTATKK
jgi:hypothetical protein